MRSVGSKLGWVPLHEPVSSSLPISEGAPALSYGPEPIPSSSTTPLPLDPDEAEWAGRSIKDLTLRLYLDEIKGNPTKGDALPPDSPINCHWPLDVHCVCTLLAYIFNQSEIKNAIPYIGCSKPACSLCKLYFKAFNEASGRNLGVCGGYGKITQKWGCPVLLNSSPDQKVQDRMKSKLSRIVLSNFQRLELEARTRKHNIIAGARKRLEQDSESAAPLTDNNDINDQSVYSPAEIEEMIRLARLRFNSQ